ncbi:radical SAM protein [Nostoc sp. T09]|uniref:polysaccharide pyruvyl transferase family protein n=1 Tax=Nostoc sp. T09 TaxID=1932621 RepID=UPI000A3C4A0A|nr:polysaccharide pyruvyl transferase family protein [Nostoc sp. T09]OUL29876.1 radical SAM protein [Nostoc sp. T09]
MYNLIRNGIKSTLTERQLNVIHQIRSLSHLAYEDIRVNMLGQVFPMKPTAISMMANDVCNSRCQMCAIWQQKKDRELSPDELEKIFIDPFFSEVRHIGITGGEPTLRKDLPELYKAACSKLPKLAGASIITNAIIEDVVKQRVSQSAAVCQEHGIDFSVMVSLDGLGEIHDEVRGRKNNFQSAINVINYFRQQNITTSFGCTITKSNALYVDELLDYAISEGIYGRFRVAEFIDRLYNNEKTDFIRNFDDKTAYHLGLFFYRVEHEFEQNTTYQNTYRNIRSMLAEGKPRQIGCPYHTQTVILTSLGDLLYCSPKSPVLGNTLQSSPGKIYFSNLAKRRDLIKNDCDNCIHDYHVPISFREKVSFFIESKQKHIKYNSAALVKASKSIIKARKQEVNVLDIAAKTVLIVGWYGTETVGDKAILWTVIQRLRSRPYPPEKIYLSSLCPFISQWTVKEMGLGDIRVVETYSQDFEQRCDEVDEVVVGGGPLMDIEALNHILYALMRASKRGAFTRVEGCGIGPLVSPLYIQVVLEILRLSDYVTLRDRTSSERSLKEFSIDYAKTVADPATDYVEYVKSTLEDLQNATPPLGRSKNISCFFREWGKDYAGSMDDKVFYSIKQQFEAQLVEMVKFIAQLKGADIHLLPMHTFHIGGDDRVLNRRLAKNISDFEQNVNFARGPVSPLEILQSMYHAEFNLCMRFHSVLFAETLGVPYLAIDYTGGGKIKAFLEERGKLNRLISLQDVASGHWQSRLKSLLHSELLI